MIGLRTICVCVIAACISIGAAAQSASEVLSAVQRNITGDKVLEANFSITASYAPQPVRGFFRMQGNAIKVESQDFSSWYDGSTLWSYAEATGEVNVTAPTAEELVAISPYAALASAEKNFTVSLLKGKDKNTHILRLVPKKGSGMQMREMVITVNATNNYITKAVVTGSDGTVTTIVINSYRQGTKLPASAFKFNKAEVPAGTPVIDLR